jgi:hypothetical protein
MNETIGWASYVGLCISMAMNTILMMLVIKERWKIKVLEFLAARIISEVCSPEDISRLKDTVKEGEEAARASLLKNRKKITFVG